MGSKINMNYIAGEWAAGSDVVRNTDRVNRVLTRVLTPASSLPQ